MIDAIFLVVVHHDLMSAEQPLDRFAGLARRRRSNGVLHDRIEQQLTHVLVYL